MVQCPSVCLSVPSIDSSSVLQLRGLLQPGRRQYQSPELSSGQRQCCDPRSIDTCLFAFCHSHRSSVCHMLIFCYNRQWSHTICWTYNSVSSAYLDFEGNSISSLSAPLLNRPLPFLSVPPFPLEIAPPPLRLGVWRAHKLPQRVRTEPGCQTYFGAFGAKICSLLIGQWRIISCVCCPLKECFCDIFAIHCPGWEKT